MLRAVYCHGKLHKGDPLSDFVTIVNITDPEMEHCTLTGADVMKYSIKPIVSLTCISEDHALNAFLNILYPTLRKNHSEQSALVLLKGIAQRSIDLSHQVRRPVHHEAPPSKLDSSRSIG
jgi:hypothetical protein